ncbi:unnamed protein product [Soboliphyme baturini]|uniref:Laminin N-terminal domain-containing protein n=1 Tax=Soboliphyme baturini TaxID=241478 RepID=A0A183IKN7_9BILA|nr:unnamed protein product [Soboliphyme baturini]
MDCVRASPTPPPQSPPPPPSMLPCTKCERRGRYENRRPGDGWRLYVTQHVLFTWFCLSDSARLVVVSDTPYPTSHTSQTSCAGGFYYNKNMWNSSERYLRGQHIAVSNHTDFPSSAQMIGKMQKFTLLTQFIGESRIVPLGDALNSGTGTFKHPQFITVRYVGCLFQF